MGYNIFMNETTNHTAIPTIYWTGIEDWSMNYGNFQFQDQLKLVSTSDDFDDFTIFTVVSYDEDQTEWNVFFDLGVDGIEIERKTFDSIDQARDYAWEKFVELPDSAFDDLYSD